MTTDPTQYRVAIPSYKRAETLRDKTLQMLSSHGIEPTRIDMFVADQAEYDTYKAVLSPGTFSNIIIGLIEFA